MSFQEYAQEQHFNGKKHLINMELENIINFNQTKRHIFSYLYDELGPSKLEVFNLVIL